MRATKKTIMTFANSFDPSVTRRLNVTHAACNFVRRNDRPADLIVFSHQYITETCERRSILSINANASKRKSAFRPQSSLLGHLRLVNKMNDLKSFCVNMNSEQMTYVFF
jgi:hypothetical protein